MNFKKSLKNDNLFWILGICLLIIGLTAFLSTKTDVVNPIKTFLPSSTPVSSYAKVTRVFDGDTIQIEGGSKVRYIGIDSAEVYPKTLCFSEEAKKANENLVMGKEVRLEKDISETDKYGRLLRYAYIGDTFINDELVRSGYAKVMTVPPDTKYQNLFLNSEKSAKEFNLGLWQCH